MDLSTFSAHSPAFEYRQSWDRLRFSLSKTSDILSTLQKKTLSSNKASQVQKACTKNTHKHSFAIYPSNQAYSSLLVIQQFRRPKYLISDDNQKAEVITLKQPCNHPGMQPGISSSCDAYEANIKKQATTIILH